MTEPMTLVVGLGKTGLSIARYLSRNKKPFMMFDSRANAPGAEAFREQWPDVALYLVDFPKESISQLEQIIASPGVSLDWPIFEEARYHGISVIGDVECLARNISAPVVAITGTNGKTTVTSLVGEMAKAAGIRTAIAGNIGTPVLDLLGQDDVFDLWVLELSSFQLNLTMSLSPHVATILNITADHLDRHGSMEGYIAAKQRIYRNAAHVVSNRADSATQPTDDTLNQIQSNTSFALDAPTIGNWGISYEDNEAYLAFGDALFFPVKDMALKGQHNWQNALTACALAKQCDIPEQAIKDVLKTLTGLDHRCHGLGLRHGIEWMNDSKGTNVGATIAAISGTAGAIDGKIILIAGGLGKGADFRKMREVVKQHVATMVLIGSDADIIEQSLSDLIPIIRAGSMDDAVLKARQCAKPGDLVLLSPACASLDMFDNYQHRGDCFVAAVERL